MKTEEIKQNLNNFDKRWEIIDGTAYAEEFIKFKPRILNLLKEIDYSMTEVGIKHFCQKTGIPEKGKILVMSTPNANS
jgi:hypothetical protein